MHKIDELRAENLRRILGKGDFVIRLDGNGVLSLSVGDIKLLEGPLAKKGTRS